MTSPARELPAGVACLTAFRAARNQSAWEREVIVTTRGELRDTVNAAYREVQANQRRAEMRAVITQGAQMTKIEKLRQQEHAAGENLKAKQVEYDNAAGAVIAAEDGYHTDSTDRAEKQWLKAKESEALAQLRLKSAQRKLTEATLEREGVERAELEREAAELGAVLNSPDPEEARLVVKEAALYAEAVKVRVARRSNNEARLQLKHRLNEVTRLLTGVAPKVWNHNFNTEPLHGSVAEEMTKIAKKAHSADPVLAHYLNVLATSIRY